MRIEGDIAIALSTHLSYIDVMKLNTKVTSSSMKDNSGVRMLRENNWRGVDLYEVIKALDLAQNKILILRLLKRHDYLRMLTLMDKDKLVAGLRFFDKEKLMRLLTLLPKSVLIKMLLHVFSMEYLFSLMPKNELFAILRSEKITNREMHKGFKQMDPKYLHFIIGKITGLNVSHLEFAEMLDILFKLKKRQVLDGMDMLSYKALTPFVLFLTQQDPTLLENISKAFMFKVFDKLSKPNLIEAFRVLPEETLIQFLSLLPDKFLMLVAADLDDSLFESYLVSQHPDLLALLGGLDAA